MPRRLLRELPVLQVLTGHDELDEDETVAMESKLRSANYRIQRINQEDDA